MVIHGIETTQIVGHCRMKIHFQCDDGVMSSATMDLKMPVDSTLWLEGMQQAVEMMGQRAKAKVNQVEVKHMLGKGNGLILPVLTTGKKDET